MMGHRQPFKHPGSPGEPAHTEKTAQEQTSARFGSSLSDRMERVSLCRHGSFRGTGMNAFFSLFTRRSAGRRWPHETKSVAAGWRKVSSIMLKSLSSGVRFLQHVRMICSWIALSQEVFGKGDSRKHYPRSTGLPDPQDTAGITRSQYTPVGSLCASSTRKQKPARPCNTR
jgi:hypothetical protein